MRSKTTTFLLIGGLCLSLILSGCASASSLFQGFLNILIVRNGSIIIGDGSDPIHNGLIAIEGDRIIFVGHEDDYSIPRGAEILDAGSGTILPGFIDSHTHSTADPAIRREFLINGVTTICDLGSPLTQLADFSLDTYQNQLVARGISAGPIITAPGGLPDAVMGTNLNYEVSSPEEGRAAVEDLIQRGARLIKVYLQEEANGIIYPMLDLSTLEAIVEEAHENGLLVRAHVTYISLLEMAVAAGVDTIEHIPVNVPSADMDQDAMGVRSQMLASPDPLESFFGEVFPEYQSQLKTMADRGTILVPTLDRPYRELFQASSQDAELAAVMNIILGIVARYYEMDGPVGLGTDFNIGIGLTEGIPPGELEMLQAAGLEPLALIEASTQNAATACGVGDVLGTLDVGKIADLIVVSGNPLEDLAILDDVILVIKGGQVAFQENPTE